ncbi:MAG: hypothetical protein JWL74_1387 [Alphaproteobacteria bacterium]|jgi:hypothetical protein|nr:hypothetical protein [Alphaproteobacteria bacterium]
MIRQLIRAEVGRRIGQRVTANQSGVGGALIGLAAPTLLRRMSMRTGLLFAGAYAAKKLYDKKREMDRTPMPLARVTRSGPATAPLSAPPHPVTEPTSSVRA